MVTDADRVAWNAARRRLTDRFARDEQRNARRWLEPETAVEAAALAIEHERQSILTTHAPGCCWSRSPAKPFTPTSTT